MDVLGMNRDRALCCLFIVKRKARRMHGRRHDSQALYALQRAVSGPIPNGVTLCLRAD